MPFTLLTGACVLIIPPRKASAPYTEDKSECLWAPMWLSLLSVQLLASAQVMISGLWELALRWALHTVGSLLEDSPSPSSSAPPSAHTLSLK